MNELQRCFTFDVRRAMSYCDELQYLTSKALDGTRFKVVERKSAMPISTEKSLIVEDTSVGKCYRITITEV
jgi:hypothetical protein